MDGVVSFPINFVNLLIYLILKEKREEGACLLRKKERKKERKNTRPRRPR